jgi:hypothetical protein
MCIIAITPIYKIINDCGPLLASCNKHMARGHKFENCHQEAVIINNQSLEENI